MFSFCGVIVRYLLAYFIVFVLDVVLNDILFNTLSGLSTFLITFDVTIQFGLKTYEFDNRNSTSFVFKFADNLLISIAIIW